MSIGSRIKEAREFAGLTRNYLAGRIGITASAISNYENSISSPKIELLYKLMEELRVDANYLYQDDMPTTSPTPTTLSPEQREYLKKYYALNHEGRGRVHAIINYEHAKQREEKRAVVEVANNTIDFPVEDVTLIDPSMPTCAGTGNPLDDNMEYGEIRVIKNKYTYGATHVIRLSGDSMEPEFHDGDRLIVTAVKYGEKPIFGRVGIFLVNGSSYLRQPLDDRLHPYNPAYEDIVPGEDDRVDYVGYVVGILDDSWVIE